MKEKKGFFIYEKSSKLPSENLAINEVIKSSIQRGDFDFIGRVYKHKKGVILGNFESIEDISLDYCKANDYEVVSRPTGGSAILTDPSTTLCYSFFVNTNKFKIGNSKQFYEAITRPLSKKLGEDFVVQGNYYIRLKKGKDSIPFAGHAMSLSNKILQFDGVVNKQKFNMNQLEKVIKLRELYKAENQRYIFFEGDFYTLSGEKVELIGEKATLLKKEYDELEKTKGLKEVGLSEKDFTDIFYNVLKGVFPEIIKVNNLNLNQKLILDYQEKIKNSIKGKRIALGHCFVDFLEPEEIF